jgi:hypothetical protein
MRSYIFFALLFKFGWYISRSKTKSTVESFGD